MRERSKIKFGIFLFSSFIFSNVLFAQVTDNEKKLRELELDSTLGWKINGVAIISFSQSSFNNWAAGGQNSISGNTIISLYAGYKTAKTSWDNTLDIGYGVVKQGTMSKWIKSDDKIDFTSKYGRKVSDKWFYAGLVNFKTQFSPGYNYPNDSVKISNFLAPAYVLAAIGFDFKPSNGISAFIAPLTSRTIYVGDQKLADAGTAGLTPTEVDVKGNIISHAAMIKNEFGGYLKLVYRKEDIVKNVNIMTKVDFFSNYLKNPQNLVVNWEALIAMKVNKILTVTFATNLIYDDAIKIPTGKDASGTMHYIGPRTQFKEVLGVGLSYKFTKGRKNK
jgi:hypothetical protein